MVKRKAGNVGITYGTFDLFHIGHLRLLQRAKEYCDYLIVAVSTDKFNEEKGKKSIINQWNRLDIVDSIKCVDATIFEHDWEQKLRDISTFDVDVLIMGDDWEGKFNDLPCEVIYLPRTDGVSTTMLKESLR